MTNTDCLCRINWNIECNVYLHFLHVYLQLETMSVYHHCKFVYQSYVEQLLCLELLFETDANCVVRIEWNSEGYIIVLGFLFR